MRSFVLLILAALAIAPPAAAQSSIIPADAPVLRPGDAVRINVWRKPDLSGEYQIAGDGSIVDPFYMDVRVGGLPLATATERVRTHIAQFETDPRVLLEPLFRVAVGGEVRQPNLYSLAPETTIAQAVMLAGGPTERGRLDRVRVLRDQRELVVDLARTDGALADTPIQSGDRIIVVRRTSVLRDYVAPFSSVVGAAAAIANALRRW